MSERPARIRRCYGNTAVALMVARRYGVEPRGRVVIIEDPDGVARFIEDQARFEDETRARLDAEIPTSLLPPEDDLIG